MPWVPLLFISTSLFAWFSHLYCQFYLVIMFVHIFQALFCCSVYKNLGLQHTYEFAKKRLQKIVTVCNVCTSVIVKHLNLCECLFERGTFDEKKNHGKNSHQDIMIKNATERNERMKAKIESEFIFISSKQISNSIIS